MQPTTDNRNKVRERIIIRRIQRQRGYHFFRFVSKPEAHEISPDGADRCGRTVDFKVLPSGRPVHGGLDDLLCMGVCENYRCFIIYARINLRFKLLRYCSDCKWALVVHQINEHWEEWIIYMLSGLEQTAKETIELIRNIRQMMQTYKHCIRQELPKIYS